MRSNYKKLGEFIRPVDERNSDLTITNLQGVSITKEFVPSIANIIGTDLSTYKIVRTGQFAYGPVTSRNGDKVSIALLKGEDCIISSSYVPFEVYKSDKLLPEYLMLWFMRPEFDRYARFMSNGSAREVFDWDCMCGVELPVPPISEQRKIVRNYQVITNRIELLQKMNEKLEEAAYLHFQKTFIDLYGEQELPDGWKMSKLEDLCDVKGGKRLPADCELIDTHTEHPYIRVRDVGSSRYVCITDQFQYIDEDTYNAISRYTVNTGDVVISIVGTIGLIGKIHSSLDGANLTENCVKLTGVHGVTGDYLYYTLRFKKDIKEIDLLTVGAVQAKLPIYNIQSIKVLVPPHSVMQDFQEKLDIINRTVEANTMEIQMLNNLKVSYLTGIARGRVV